MAKLTALVMKVKTERNTMLVVTQAGDFWEVPLPNPIPAAGSQVEVMPPAGFEPVVQTRETGELEHMNQTEQVIPVSADYSDRKTGVNMKQHRSRPAVWSKQWFPAVAACLMLLVIGSLNFFFYAADREQAETKIPAQVAALEPAYVVVIDINPSVELWLDDSLNYLGAEALNQEATTLLNRANISPGTPLVLAVQKLVAAAREYNYLIQDQDNLMVATLVKTALNNQDDFSKLQETTAQVEEMLLITLAAQDGLSTEVALRTATGEMLTDAREQKISINKLFVVEELHSRGIQVDPDQVKGEKIGKLLQETGVPPGQIIRELKQVGTKKHDQEDLIQSIADVKEQVNSSENNYSSQGKGQDKQQEKELDKDKDDKAKDNHKEEKSIPGIPQIKDVSKPNLKDLPRIPEIPKQNAGPKEIQIPQVTLPERPQVPRPANPGNQNSQN